eukprot:scaffold35175_cov129-Isochrysis_galbana.AAC.2
MLSGRLSFRFWRLTSCWPPACARRPALRFARWPPVSFHVNVPLLSDIIIIPRVCVPRSDTDHACLLLAACPPPYRRAHRFGSWLGALRFVLFRAADSAARAAPGTTSKGCVVARGRGGTQGGRIRCVETSQCLKSVTRLVTVNG